MKKFLAFTLALVMMFALAVPAYAVETGDGDTLDPVTKTSTFGTYEGFYEEDDLYPGFKAFNVYVEVPAAYEGVFQSDSEAKTTDFIKQAVTYVLPADADGNVASGQFPALIQCVRYDLGSSTTTGRFNSNDSTAKYLLERGYAVIKIDLRGMGASSGIAKGFGTEENGLDVKYIIEHWLADQTWYSGKCAMYGSSNQGVIGNTTAVHNPSSMEGYQIGVASVDYYSQKYNNGVSIANNNGKLLPAWSVDKFPTVVNPTLIFGPTKSYTDWMDPEKGGPTAQFVDDDPEGKEAYKAYVIQQTNNEMFFSYMTVPNVYRDSTNEAGWAVYEDIVLLEEIYDLVASGIYTYNYAGYADIASTAQLALANVTDGNIVISNGNHGGAMRGGSFPNFDSNADFVRYFDWLLKGVGNGFDQTPFAYYYLLDTNGNANGTLPEGQNPAHYTDNLPFDNTIYRDFYFDTNQIIDSESPYWLTGGNNGSLSTDAPVDGDSVDYRVDTSISFDITGMGNGPIGTTNLAPSIDSKSITYTTAPLTEKTQYIGNGTMDIYASCNNSNDFDLIGVVEVVREDGSSNYLSRGAIRASHRYPSIGDQNTLWNAIGLSSYMHSSLKADVLDALAEGIDEPTLLKFNLELAGVTLNEGDCLRVTLFCVTKRAEKEPKTQSYMYYDTAGNLMTGDNLPLITFYTGGAYASKLTLPIYTSVDNTLNGTVTLDDGSYNGPATMYMLEDYYYLQYNGKWMELDKSTNEINYTVDENGKADFYKAGFTFRPEGTIIADGLAQLYKGGATGTYAFPSTFDGYRSTVVSLRQGDYLGKQVSGVLIWKGIQYAKAPLFQAPEAMPDAESGAAAIEAYEHGMSTSGAGSADEDCLNLCVYVNPDWDVEKDGPRDVFMWIFGSANSGGATSNSNWAEFVQENPGIIVVTPNHRGGLYGSLDLSQLEGYDDPANLDANGENIYRYSNNIARMDVLEVLKWINANIEDFGGNKNSVAIGGQSSGGNLCAAVMMMPESKNLWHKALLQESFPLDGSLMPLDEAKTVATATFDNYGITTLEGFFEKNAEELAKPPVEAVTPWGKMLTYPCLNSITPAGFGYKALSPVIDDVVIRSDYYEQLLGPDGLWAGKPVLFGSNEGGYDQIYDPTRVAEDEFINTARRRSAGNLGSAGWYGYSVGDPADPDYIPNYADYIIDQYRANDPDRTEQYAAMDLDQDMNMRIPSILFAEAACESTNVYYYRLNFNSSSTISFARAAHGSENSVIMRTWAPNARGDDSADDRAIVADRISDIWAQFILTGDPNNADLGGATWVPYSSGTRDTMVLDNEFYMVDGVRNEDTDLLLPLTREYSKLISIGGVPTSSTGGVPNLSNTEVLPVGLPARATSDIIWSVVDSGSNVRPMIIRATIEDGMVDIVNGSEGTSAGVVTSDYTEDFKVSVYYNTDPTYYTVSFNTDGGSAVANQSVSAGGKATQPPDPTKEGYTFGGWYTSAELTTVYNFNTAVNNNTVIYAKWNAIPSGTPFIDVDENDWFYEDVNYVVDQGLMNGTANDVFSPNDSMTRAMVVTVLYRHANEPDVSSLTNPFSDVPNDMWYTDAVKWAAENDIVTGYDNGLFGLMDPISREDLAVILYRYEQLSKLIPPDVEPQKDFSDWDDVSEYAKDAVSTLTKQGIINGKPGNLFDPKGEATRAEVSAMLHRFLEAVEQPFPGAASIDGLI